MSDNLAVAAGNKFYPMRELGFDDISEMLNITAAQAALLSRCSAVGGKHPTTGAKEIKWNAVFEDTSVALTLTDYSAMGIGSQIFIMDSGTFRLAIKASNSATPVIGDWYYVDLTNVT